uniref:Uncharacterized protein n=1 Tax=Arundo donax TaxID=35708 RepID=A0A0A8ZME6_ARUDO
MIPKCYLLACLLFPSRIPLVHMGFWSLELGN